MEVMEEGEIRPSVQNDTVGPVAGMDSVAGEKVVGQSGDASAPSVANEQVQEGEGSPTPQMAQVINSNMGNLNLHGEGDNLAHVNNLEVDTGDLFIPKSNIHVPNGPLDGGPVGPVSIEGWNSVEKECGPNVVNELPNRRGGNEGPTPANHLGKRNRADRSPPSLGSLQGPSQRVFGQPERIWRCRGFHRINRRYQREPYE
ncbi:hypothetical protein Hanom_Chr05g00389351 [Helianthus anomalus]